MKVTTGEMSLEKKVALLAHVRGEAPATVAHKYSENELATIPSTFSKHIPALRKTRLLETGLRDGMAFARTPDGKIFYGYPSKANHRRAYHFVKDLLPQEVTEDTFLVSLDVAQRYATDFTWPPGDILPQRSGTVVECGAYLGYKTIRFAEELVPDGKILAIELMPENVNILRRNVAEAGLSDRITIVQAGVWHKPDTLLVKGKGRQRNTLVELDKLKDDTNVVARVDTLDNLLDEWEIGDTTIDLLFVTVNGAEIEALQGLHRWMARVRGLFVAAPYERNGQPNADTCREILDRKGCTILASSNPSRVIALGPSFTG